MEIWIEAEMWPIDQWNMRDGNTDVIVTLSNGERWVATCISYENVRTLTEKNRKTGENLAGAYFWVSDMLLVDEISRPRIEAVVSELIESDMFGSIFRLLED